jgi:hypothetical protein
MRALSRLRDEVADIRRFREIAAQAKVALQGDANESRRGADAKRREGTAAARARVRDSLLNEARALERRAYATKREAQSWQREVDRQVAIRLETSFEVFLRDCLIEKVAEQPERTCRVLARRLGLNLANAQVRGKVAGRADALGRVLDNTSLLFHDFADAVNAKYKEWLGRGYLEPNHPRSTFASQARQQATQYDLQVLAQLRHIIVHKRGVPNSKYHSILGGECCWPRLDPSVSARPQGAGQAPRPERVRGPDDVLSSPGMENPTKLEDFYAAVLAFAEHIDAIY